MEHLKDWATGVALAAVIGWGLKWAYAKGCELVVNYAMKQLMFGLHGGNVQDKDIGTFIHDVTLAFMKLAEKKLPDSGLGPERKKWVIEQLTKRLPILKGQEQMLGDIIERLITIMNSKLQVEIQDEEHFTG